MYRSTGWNNKRAVAIGLLVVATTIALQAQTLTTLASFNVTNGQQPQSALVQSSDGNLFGTTYGGGIGGFGTIFEITSGGALATLYSFCSQEPTCEGGGHPYAGLFQASDGSFYGTTQGGDLTGTIFKISPGGALTTLYIFCSEANCNDGKDPYAGLIQASDGNFYGTTSSGGAHNGGTIFKITESGTLTTLYSFCYQANCADGQQPYAGLIQASDGNFYGTTLGGGGASGYGTVFKITPGSTLTTFVQLLFPCGMH